MWNGSGRDLQFSIQKKQSSEASLEEGRELTRLLSGGKESQTKGTATAQVLIQEQTQYVQRTPRRLMPLEYDKGEANGRPGGQRGCKGIKPCWVQAAIGGSQLLLLSYHVIWCCGRRAGASKVMGQGKGGRYVLVLIQDPRRWSSKGQQRMNDLKGQARRTKKFQGRNQEAQETLCCRCSWQKLREKVFREPLMKECRKSLSQTSPKRSILPPPLNEKYK